MYSKEGDNILALLNNRRISMSFNWINAEGFSINSILLMDRWILQQLAGLGDSPMFETDENYRKLLGIALAYNPTIYWYFINKSPESAERVNRLVEIAPKNLSHDEVRKSEIKLLDMIDSFIVYLYPEVMNANCPYIRDWDSERLLSIVDFTDKVVLDVGSGTGRLAFAAATKAKKVYASEPVDRMREYMRDKIQKEKVSNVVVLDGIIEAIPFEANTFDIAMCGYVLGLDIKQEIANLERVTKNGGYIINCMGDDARKNDKPNEQLLNEGFKHSHYISKMGGDVYRYWKKVIK
jgi:hypothetical protein